MPKDIVHAVKRSIPPSLPLKETYLVHGKADGSQGERGQAMLPFCILPYFLVAAKLLTARNSLYLVPCTRGL